MSTPNFVMVTTYAMFSAGMYALGYRPLAIYFALMTFVQTAEGVARAIKSAAEERQHG